MARKLLVIGSNSFSGASFVDFALGQGVEVVGVSRSPEPHPAFLPYRWSNRQTGFRFFRCDLNQDIDPLTALIMREKPAQIVNFAAQSMVGESWNTPEHWFQTNVVATIRLHDRLRHCDFLDRYVHVTTPEVYGSVSGTIDETAPLNPSTPYAVSRAAADMSLRTFFAAYGFPVVFTRAANVYGPGQALYRIIPRTMMFIREGRKLGLQGGGTSQRSFIHIRDVADATWRIMADGVVGETYHISTESLISIRALVERICALMGVPFSAAVDFAPDRLGKDSLYSLDSTKLRRTLGWQDRIGLDAGLEDCLAWIDAHFQELQDHPHDYVHRP